MGELLSVLKSAVIAYIYSYITVNSVLILVGLVFAILLAKLIINTNLD